MRRTFAVVAPEVAQPPVRPLFCWWHSGHRRPEATPSATLDIVFGNIAINVSRWTTIIAASVTLVIHTKLIAWFELWRGRRVSRRMARCRARLYRL